MYYSAMFGADEDDLSESDDEEVFGHFRKLRQYVRTHGSAEAWKLLAEVKLEADVHDAANYSSFVPIVEDIDFSQLNTAFVDEDGDGCETSAEVSRREALREHDA